MTRPHWRIPHLTQERHYGLGTICDTIDGHSVFGHTGVFQGFGSRTAVVPDWGVSVSVVTNSSEGLAVGWVDGILHILSQFARRGAPTAAVSDWTGRWWSIFSAIDLVPMGERVMVAAPSLLAPFGDASELTVADRMMARVTLANGFANHGEPVHRSLDQDGAPTHLDFCGMKLLPEQAFAAELAARE